MPIAPNQGAATGGTAVVITGTNLSSASAVRFGPNTGTITANTATQIDVTSPPGNGVVGVTVTTPGGTSSPLTYFYVQAPIKTSISPTTGATAGGNAVTLNGQRLTGATAVTFGANAGTITATNDGQITVTAPAGAAAGAVSVTVSTPGGTVDGLFYTYADAPAVTTISPNSGPEDGGNALTITGTQVGSTSEVTFDGAAASFGVLSATQVAAVVPPGTAGAVDVVVTAAGGTDTEIGGYTYVAGPGV